VRELRNILKKKKLNPMIIAKMETAEGMRNFDEILELVDGIMVARGDLGVEFPAEEIPFLQKMMVKKANALGKPVIVATQMMESMIQNPVPTRAEVSDVANAILDGADAVMLSAETSVGKYPEKVVSVMKKVALEVEEELDQKHFERRRTEILGEKDIEVEKVIPRYAVKTANDIDAKVISVFSETGFTARNIARFRPFHSVFVFSPNIQTLRQTTIFYGLLPATTEIVKTILDAEKVSKKFLTENKLLKKGEKFVVVAGVPFREPGNTNIIYVSE
jgi:pyruvate kinase